MRGLMSLVPLLLASCCAAAVSLTEPMDLRSSGLSMNYNQEFGVGDGVRQHVATTAAANVLINREWWMSKVSCLKEVLGAERASATLYLPGSLEYNNTLFIDNARVVLTPRCVVSPRDEGDVAAAMLAARNCSLHFSVVSGGHSAQGYGLAQGGLTLNMRSLTLPGAAVFWNTTADMDSKSKLVATIGAGTRWAEVYSALDARNKGEMIVGGGCPQVGLGGFIQGGGWSFLSRSYGMSVDQLHSLTIVLPNLTVATLSASHPDRELWWAVRGGGGGNWGVVTNYTMAVNHPEPLSTNGELCWEELDPKIRPMMELWIELWPVMPDWLLLLPCWLPMGDGANKTRRFCFTVICNNVASECDPWLALLRANGPLINTLKIQSYGQWAGGNNNVTSANEGYLYLKSYGFRPENMTIQVFDLLMDAIRTSPSDKNLVLSHIGGGAVNRVPRHATAFVHRDWMMLLQIKSIWLEPHEEEVNRAWINNVSTQLEPHVTGAYVNYIDADLEDWSTKYYGVEGYAKLQRIKRRVDPENFFHFNQSIGSGFPLRK